MDSSTEEACVSLVGADLLASTPGLVVDDDFKTSFEISNNECENEPINVHWIHQVLTIYIVVLSYKKHELVILQERQPWVLVYQFQFHHLLLQWRVFHHH